MASEPLDGKRLAVIRQRVLLGRSDASEVWLLALVDELREALQRAYEHTQPDWVEQHAENIAGYATICNHVAELLARTAPPAESRSVERPEESELRKLAKRERSDA